MRKELSDLPKSQRGNYHLGLMIDLFSMIGCLLVFMALFVAQIINYPGWVLQSDLVSYLVVSGIGFSLIVGLILSYLIKHQMKIYTDFDVERIERNLKRVKDALKDE
jgi:uncharacterized membrane protein YciS (DUF1049 family)